MKILVTGASGFVGSHLVRSLQKNGHEVLGTSRTKFDGFDEGVHVIAGMDDDFASLIEDVDLVVHAAGVAHHPTNDPVELRALFEKGNRDWTQRLAAAVAESSVRGMIHISSIAAAGEMAGDAQEDQALEFLSDYGRSKREAEPAVSELGTVGKLGVNLRPPLIYGKGTKGNWAKIQRLAETGLPLPFLRVLNQRSYLSINNLCDLVEAVSLKLDHPELSGTYQIADNGFVSLLEVLSSLREGFGQPPRLFPFPAGLMKIGFNLLGKRQMAKGLFDDLKLNAAPLRDAFDWVPAVTTLEGMRDTASDS
ncbi:MAG: NAD-dependent epimerase/dehydratase family protein [Verrucomicrobiales bacterium]|nr:NAD-dependent epimerase/dehydratase family protein [Verrucomicrobiales bacterium]